MKKILLISSIFILLTSFIFIDTYVYICKGEGSKRYHLIKNCRGLKACTHKIDKITLKSAEKIGKTLCKWED
ncbi:MAG: hypothetical protein ACYCZ2_09905 [Lutibacter sp.]